MRSVLLSLVLGFLITIQGFCSVGSAAPSNWTEVTRFTGSGTELYTTNYFNCSHVEWRIRWEYVPNVTDSDVILFWYFTYPIGENVTPVASVYKSGVLETSGASYIHDDAGTFYMKIGAVNTESYAIIVEEDLDSIPEFSPHLILPLFIAATLLAVIVYKAKVKDRQSLFGHY